MVAVAQQTPPTANEKDKGAETRLCCLVLPLSGFTLDPNVEDPPGRTGIRSFSHGPSQPIDQCKSKVVTSGHDILRLVFESAYRSESLCTCRQKHWGRGLTHTARRFQLHVCICQGALRALPFMKTTSGTRAREAGCGLDVTRPLGSTQRSFLHSSDSFSLQAELLWCSKSPEIKVWFVSEEKWFLIPNERPFKWFSNILFF